MFRHNDTLKFPVLKQVNLDSGRVYRVESGANAGLVYPSITRILGSKPKPELDAWKKKVGKDEAARVSARATVRGAGLHKLAECHLNNEELPKMSPTVIELWTKLRPWLNAHITCVYAQEQDLCSHKLMVAGRTDCVADVDNDAAIVDFKQSDKPKKPEYVHDYFLQGTFYALAVYELTGKVIKRIVIPVSSPETFQVFESEPKKHFKELLDRITVFYQSFTPPVDTETTR